MIHALFRRGLPVIEAHCMILTDLTSHHSSSLPIGSQRYPYHIQDNLSYSLLSTL